MQPKNKFLAAILAFALGFVGVHKLYLGKIGAFIGLMILFIFTVSTGAAFVPFLVAFIQGIKLLKMSDINFDNTYNRGQDVVRKGPLETRRYAQMRRYEQEEDYNPKSGRMLQKPSNQNLKSNPYKASGIKKYKDFDLEEAILDFKKGLEIAPNDVSLHFNIACAYSLTEKKMLAYHHITQAIKYGMKDVDKILSHDDLAFVRIQPQFDTFRAGGFLGNPFVQASATSESSTPSFASDTTVNITDDTLLAQLNQLSELRKKGILSESEFLFERKKVLRN